MIVFFKNKVIGTTIYYLLWPLVWFYAPLNRRVRVLIVVGSDVLLVKNWFGPNAWQLPGGGTKISESTKSTAVRELSEELGLELELNSIKIINKIPIVVHIRGLLFRYHYAVLYLDNKPNVRLSSELTESKWVDIKELNLPASIRATLL
jgi:8-oxo-dGTP pyrophosphatase MutT (NUDIX family)